MYVQLDEWRVADAVEAMDLPRLDHENVAGARFEFLPVDGPEAAAFSHKLDFVVGMAMGSGATAGESPEEEY